MEFDLGTLQIVQRAVLVQEDSLSHHFIVEAKENNSGEYRMIIDGSKNQKTGKVEIQGPPTQARFVRVRFIDSSIGGLRATAFRLYGPDSDRDLASGNVTNTSAQELLSLVNPKNEHRVNIYRLNQAFFIAPNVRRCYLAGGAVLRIGLRGHNLGPLRIDGRGILEGTHLERKSFRNGNDRRPFMLELHQGKDIEVDGINVLDATSWMLVFLNCNGVKVTNVSAIGCAENNDGLHFSASSNCEARGVFVRCSDDLMGIYTQAWNSTNLHIHDIAFRNSVVWNEKAHCFFVFPSTGKAGIVERVTYENIDVLFSGRESARFDGVCSIKNVWSGNKNEAIIREIAYRNIRVSHLQGSRLIHITTQPFTNIRNVTFEHLSYDETYPEKALVRPALIQGHDASHTVSGLLFGNLSISGRAVDKASALNLQIGQHVHDWNHVVVEAPTASDRSNPDRASSENLP